MASISVKSIGGKRYLYLVDSIYIDKGKTVTKHRSLGRAGLSIDIEKKLQAVRQEMEQLEIRERSDYWKDRIENKRVFQHFPIESIEQLRSKLYRGKQGLGPIGTQAMETAFIIDFIYNSNKIEGSKLPQKKVQEIVRARARTDNEVSNTMRAIDFFDEYTSPFTYNRIKQAQSILLAHEKDKIGIRTVPYVVGNSPVLDHSEITDNLKDLLRWYNEQERNGIYPPELAFLFHYRFERIHPFKDGNGRIGRILMNLILKKHKYHPIIVWNKRRTAYFSSFVKGIEGNIDAFLTFMLEQYKHTYSIYITKMEPALSLDKQLSMFLTPSEPTK